MKDILACPPGALHSTKEVAEFIGRTVKTVRTMVYRGHLKAKVRTHSSLLFETHEVRRWIDKARTFKSGLGVPWLKTGPDDA